MALLKCKMCGGSLEVAAGETIIECEYCGTQQTLPKTTDENIQALFNRANLLRQKNEFDKAEAVYEKILEADDTEAEAYWGVILCKFGIEYVEDPKTYKRIPTCHRTSYDSIVADEYYKKAIENADITQRTIYEAEAKKIDEIQKGILAISAQEEPYDVFICYKETDPDGRRTQDSVIANDIYYQLTQEGFKVFYAAITLEGKLGSAYEPIIFAALNSAKVMLSIGTKPEYFNAVWVKNEWSRFLKMMKNDRSRILIPCYKGMDAYELPEEFAHLQAQDMGKIGFINDIVRGIKKVIVKDEPKSTVVKETVVTSANPSVDPLLKRAFMFLEDEDFAKADDFCEQVLNQDPENAQAYLGKLLSELQVRKQESLKDCTEPFDYSNNYQKAVRFADEKLKTELTGYIEHINTRNENARLDGIYTRAKNAMSAANTESAYTEAAELFESISTYLDAQSLSVECREKAEVCRKNDIYNNAISQIRKATVASFVKAIELFKTISGWKDSDEQITKCEAKLPELRDKEEKERIYTIKRARRKKIIVLAAIVAVIIMSIAIAMISAAVKSDKYDKMLELYKSENYIEAYDLCRELSDYKNCDRIILELEKIILEEAHKLYLDGEAYDAVMLLDRCNIADPGYRYVLYGQYSKAVAEGLEHIVIPNGVTNISYHAFYECGKLKSVTIPDSVTSIGNSAFYECKSLTSVTIPDSVTSIGNSAFYECKSLTSVTIGNSVTSIGDWAFYGCTRLKIVTIPDSVTSIGDGAFSVCTSLTNVYINDISAWCEVSFANSSANPLYYAKNLYLTGELVTALVIPDGVTSIGDYAFYDCDSLTSVTIPDSVTSIGDSAFSRCLSLKTINYTGTESKWAAIEKGSSAIPSGRTIVYNYTEE